MLVSKHCTTECRDRVSYNAMFVGINANMFDSNGVEKAIKRIVEQKVNKSSNWFNTRLLIEILSQIFNIVNIGPNFYYDSNEIFD